MVHFTRPGQDEKITEPPPFTALAEDFPGDTFDFAVLILTFPHREGRYRVRLFRWDNLEEITLEGRQSRRRRLGNDGRFQVRKEAL